MIDNLENTINIDGKTYTETQIKEYLTERILLQNEVDFLRTELQKIANNFGTTQERGAEHAY